MSDILAQFKALKLYGMASSYAELRQQNTPDVADSFNFADTLLNQLLQAETTEHDLRSIRYQTQAARFPVQRHLQGFDFSQSKVDRQLIHQRANKAGLPCGCCRSTWSFSTNWAICHSHKPVVHYCFICSPGCMNVPVSLSPPTSHSQNGATYSSTPK